MIPSQRAIIPVRPIDISKPVLALSNKLVTIVEKISIWPRNATLYNATIKPMRKKPIQT
ncbi:hypothetical protein D3C87_1750860 [compost metagenome]